MERENARLGPYPSEVMAVRVAISGAVQCREQDQSARVSLYDRSGNVCAEYAFVRILRSQ